MRKKGNEYIIDAIATYLSVQGIRTGVFIPDIDTREITEMLFANERQKEQAVRKAFQIIKDFK